MANDIDRRAFLKISAAAAAAAAGAFGCAAGQRQTSTLMPADVRLGDTPYTPVLDYPIRPTPYYGVTMKDEFWAPKIALNAAVTIESAAGGRGLSGGVLEAAIMSLKTHPNPALQATVEARVRS